jgi:hypothetical protein
VSLFEALGDFCVPPFGSENAFNVLKQEVGKCFTGIGPVDFVTHCNYLLVLNVSVDDRANLPIPFLLLPKTKGSTTEFLSHPPLAIQVALFEF